MTSNEYKDIINWVKNFYDSVHRAGGVPNRVLSLYPDELLEILIRNDLKIVYDPRKTK